MSKGADTVREKYGRPIRLPHTPGELLDDRKVSTPRGFLMNVLNVEGEQLDIPRQ